jgi:uncharacterized protein (TIGR03382 family)
MLATYNAGIPGPSSADTGGFCSLRLGALRSSLPFPIALAWAGLLGAAWLRRKRDGLER